MDCLFCKIIAGEIPSKKIYEDEYVYAFYDIHPQAPVHFLVIPKRHIATLDDATLEDKDILGHLLYTASVVAKNLGLAQKGYRQIINCKEYGGQEVYHLHLHILGGTKLSSLN